MATDIAEVGRHRGRPKSEMPTMTHCCFAGCTVITCPRCCQQVCVRQGLHDCRPPYVGRHRSGDVVYGFRTQPNPVDRSLGDVVIWGDQ